LPPQTDFFPRHLAIIALVIEARQMQDAMQYKNLGLVRDGMPQTPGILPRDVSGDRYLSRNAASLTPPPPWRWKRQHVRGVVCPAESPVE
jgi:hypothetical protein